MRIALVDISHRHDEIFPFWIQFARQKGLPLDIFTSDTARQRDIFSVMHEKDISCQVVVKKFRHLRGIRRLIRRIHNGISLFLLARKLNSQYDLVIANSIEPLKDLKQFYRKLRLPVLAVMHNADKLISHPEYARFHQAKNTQIMTLAPMITRYLEQHGISSGFIHPVYPLRIPDLKKTKNHFAVQGYVQQKRRNYNQLLPSAKAIDKTSSFTIRLIGRENDLSREITAGFNQAGMSSRIMTCPDGQAYETFYRYVGECEFLLVLIDRSKDYFKAYFKDKCTSSVNTALSLGCIPVINQELAELYGIAACSVTYVGDDLTSGLNRALSMTDEEKEVLLKALLKKRGDWLRVSVEQADACAETLGLSN